MPNSRVLLKWETWVYGLVAGFIGGGANAVITSTAISAIFPATFSATAQLRNFLMLLLVTFITSGVLAAMAFLAKSPLPPLVEQVETDRTITPTSDGGVHIATTTTTSEVAKADAPK